MTAISKEDPTHTQRQLNVALELGWNKWNVGIHASEAPSGSAPKSALEQYPRPETPPSSNQPPRPRLWRRINCFQTRNIETQVHLNPLWQLAKRSEINEYKSFPPRLA